MSGELPKTSKGHLHYRKDKEVFMKRALAFGFMFLFLTMALTVQAQAQVTLGPIVDAPGTPEDQFPLWVMDSAGNFASMCTGAQCGEFEINPDGTLGEAFYYQAATEIAIPGGTVLAEFFVEAAGPEEAGAASLLEFGSGYRVRLDEDTVDDLTFTVSNPWTGITTDVTVLAGDGDSGNVTGNGSVEVPAPFTPGSLLTDVPIDLFVSNGTGGATRFGDGATAAPLANGFVVEVTGAATATGTDFIVVGARFVPAGAENVTVERATATLGRGRGTGVLIISTVIPDAQMNITSIGGTALPAPGIPLNLNTTNGRFSAVFPFTGVTGAPSVQVTVTGTGAPAAPLSIPLEDTITIRNATFRTDRRAGDGSGILMVRATSSFNPAPQLSVQSTVPVPATDPVTGDPIPGATTQQVVREFGPMAGRGVFRVPARRTDPPMQGPPAFVTVTSAAGGSETVPVDIR